MPQSPPWKRIASEIALWTQAFLLGWVLYATLFLLLRQIAPSLPFPSKATAALDPFRIVNSYGLFGRMTWARYEIEFQGSNDGVNWTAYPFRYKPQALNEAPGIYAPYQPRFEWNLWFASLGGWRENPFVVRAEQQLLLNNNDVLSFFQSVPRYSADARSRRAVAILVHRSRDKAIYCCLVASRIARSLCPFATTHRRRKNRGIRMAASLHPTPVGALAEC